MKKILIIPSWYPTPKNKLIGNYFREQALILNDKYDFFVVFVSPYKVGLIKFLYYYLKKKSFFFDIQTPPEGIGIKYLQIKFPRFFSWFVSWAKFRDRLNFKLMCKLSFISLSNELNKLSWNPDIIHAQATEDGGILANYLSEKFRIPYLITEHQLFLLQYYTNLKKYNISKAIEKSAKMIVVSEHQKRQILMTRIECDPVVLGNLIDDSLFTISKTKKDVFNILVVTYPHYIKDNETLYKAIRCLLSEQVKDFKVRIVGGDISNTALTDKENPLYKEAENYGITKCVEILNHVDREKMPEIINTCDVLVSTSIAETFGIACCEAMMCGVPVISTANGGIDEMISEKNGIKIPIRDEKALAAAILQIKNKVITFNPDEIRNSVVDKFGRKAFKTKSSEIYDSV
ncbi:MAG TPA: glycosyltransferase [Bacteroidales bacterium]|nr:glycosyltransferase [Bacteroidales bacterium]